MSFCEERLRDVFRWRGCVIFPTHLLTKLRDFFLWRGCIIFFEVALFLLWRGCVIFLRLPDLFWWRGCVFFCAERLCFVDRLHDFMCGEVA